MNIKNNFLQFSNILNAIFKTLSIVLLAVLFLLTFFGVIARYVFNNPIVWLYELTLVLFSWMIFSGVSVAFKTGENICLDLLKNFKSPVLHKILSVVANLSTVVFFLIVMTKGLIIVQNTSAQIYNTIDLSTAWFYAPLPICAAVALIHFIAAFLEGKNPLGSTINLENETVREA